MRSGDTYPVLPTVERRDTADRNTILARFLEGLLPPDELKNKPYYRGDIYEDKPTRWATLWEGETRGQYIDQIRRSLKYFPELEYLRNWMEVSTSVSRHTYLSQNPQGRTDRAGRVHITQIDFKKGQKPEKHEYKNRVSLDAALNTPNDPASRPDARIYIVEDLSRDMIELLGSKFNVDPHFFRSHLNDYMWNAVLVDGVEQRDLDIVRRKRPHFMMRYLRSRYYRNTKAFESALEQSANFNVLRQIDSDRSREYLMDKEGAAVCLMRAKTSLWTCKSSMSEPFALGILLVDPTPSDGFPLWGGYTSFSDWESISSNNPLDAPPRTSLYDDVVHWTYQLSEADVAEVIDDPRALAIPALRLMLSDWHDVIQYMTTQIAQIEWQIELPDWGKSSRFVDDKIMRKLHPWRRNISLYRAMISDAIHRLYAEQAQTQSNPANNDHSLQSLLPDFKVVLSEIDTIQTHIAQLVSVATAFQSLDEGRRAMDQNNNVAQLTYLATLFIPLSFVSGLLSMVPDVTQLRQTFWIFFTIAVPLTAGALVAADFLGLRKIVSRFLQKQKK